MKIFSTFRKTFGTFFLILPFLYGYLYVYSNLSKGKVAKNNNELNPTGLKSGEDSPELEPGLVYFLLLSEPSLNEFIRKIGGLCS